MVHFHRLFPAVVAEDMRRDLAVGGGFLGLLGSAYFYPYALMRLPAISDCSYRRKIPLRGEKYEIPAFPLVKALFFVKIAHHQ